MKSHKLSLALLLLVFLKMGALPTPASAAGEELSGPISPNAAQLLELILQNAMGEEGVNTPLVDAESGALVIGFLTIPNDMGITDDQMKEIIGFRLSGLWTSPSGTLYDFRRTALKFSVGREDQELLRMLENLGHGLEADSDLRNHTLLVSANRSDLDPLVELPEALRTRLRGNVPFTGAPSSGCREALRLITKEF
ncbi:MAG TPA: hypothetical protein VM901_04350 [Bdellovibrionota bacterium]|jgi:hypothetical protein|nr:hypothetical protein [Bdellovibrionota bacterium]